MPDETDLNPLDPNNILKVNDRPIQMPGMDQLVRTSVVGGPETSGDRRAFLSAKLLDDLLQRAKTSPTLRVEISRAGVRVDLYKTPSGHQYEVWTLIGANPVPEQLSPAIQALVHGTTVVEG